MSKQTLDFWFEFASSYSYLSVMRIEALAREAKVTVVWRPFLLGPVFLSLGWNDSPFNIYPPKGRYMWRDLARLSGKYGLPFQVPSRFPRNGLLAARVALTGADQPWIGDFTRAVMQANFAQDREIAEPAVIEEILTRLNLPAAALLEQANSPENKQALRRQTEQAGELGLFGAPSFITPDGEVFWGNDRLEDALAWVKAHG
ncbi:MULTISPECIES: 2-hydroxychromene-2-carboxylate isomerase [Zoogloea]|jgi:2-hydroxychromene-2-carboxylate isomerase|uniref:2-hydroxychromene-2-carboxylate isomerase n=1 Tax=Zoogloea oleivorans TaxID=1552750 RepID=A0A6C2D611_9RHOO|nr:MULTISPECIES: 2-hydroxychromene-2-carboxylate isomerase [Zoogloea]MBP6801615.1 2-hydroxychromene-2-carboxylate isomerase [Zoogloea sp.]MBT9497599.1 2-hydroxychromene-2-carboxylate isomerase [Zoogloea sp.]MDD2668589.1 2-hydroxychromene-2-carboxylate isomerase [Zoogloea sp.]MDY0035206.1 2-hydroxychromene-2-carboxylate isomerase [Zoogloea oleivorans]TYC61486.1 2-hydroxychromene-2-carboxylate isomerase [Zoogloea oleivorans]